MCACRWSGVGCDGSDCDNPLATATGGPAVARTKSECRHRPRRACAEAVRAMLTERSGQLDALNRRLSDLLRSPSVPPVEPPVAVLTGPVGAGKTSLLHAFARQAADSGARFLGAGASRGERSVPLEVVRQLVGGLPPGDEDGERIGKLLDEAAAHWFDADGRQGRSSSASTAAIGGALLKLAAQGPLVIGVDDVHYADLASLRCLDHVARRAGGFGMLIVLTEPTRTVPWQAAARVELLRPTRARRIRVPLLSTDGTYDVLAARLGVPAARALAEECHRVSDGNPTLLHALIDDQPAAEPADGRRRPVVGEAFREAVVGCLHRCEQLVLKTAQALAITGESPGSGLLQQLTGSGNAGAPRVVGPATSAGLVDDHGLRHPAVRQAVLDAMTAEEQAQLHSAAGSLLYERGAPPEQVARQLVMTSHTRTEPWMVQTLLDAGEQALTDGDVPLALRYLRRANRDCHDDAALLARINSALIRAEWYLDPGVAASRLTRLTTAVHAGNLGGRQAAAPIPYLLAHADPGEVAGLGDRLAREPGLGDPYGAAVLVRARSWLTAFHPGARAGRAIPVALLRDPLERARAKQAVRGLITLRSVLRHGARGVVEEAERGLAAFGPDDEWNTGCVLAALIHADRLDAAAAWCDRLVASVPAYHQRTPSALITTGRAMIAERRGDLPAAAGLAAAALAQLPPKSWGVLVGVPLGVRIRSLVLMNDLEEAARTLKVPLPPRLFETPFGLQYLQARGRYALAAGSPQDALADFQLCGRLMKSWRLDLPGLLPWRTETAQVLLRTGRREAAARLARQELDLVPPGQSRNRGVALRVLAATEEGAARMERLRTSVGLLRGGHDRGELAQSVIDLGHAHQLAGDPRRARALTREAYRLADDCGLPALWPSTSAMWIRSGGGGGEAAAAVEGLTEEEVEVAELAALGHTNREIAGRLFLTVSAIEQRLTRIYRKLDITSRTELAVRLHLTDSEQARGAPAGPHPEDG
ncbi:hypothetical protein GCM10027073_64060 [Streptomyces chlorus]|uniref:AAA family ATPase n=1 Tax=Streptomyces chlorus TaxID=887452 RepID=A0ABW1E7Z7_9ACTN